MGGHNTMEISNSFGITGVKAHELEKELQHAMIDYETWSDFFKHFKLQGEREFLVFLIGRMVEDKQRKAHSANGLFEGLIGGVSK